MIYKYYFLNHGQKYKPTTLAASRAQEEQEEAEGRHHPHHVGWVRKSPIVKKRIHYYQQ